MSLIAARLMEARQAKGLSRQQLAERVDLTPQAINQYENGVRSPNGDVLNMFAFELGVPVSFFTTPKVKSIQSSGPLFFRARKAIRSQKHNAKYHVLTKWLAEVREWLGDSIEFPEVKLPTFPDKDSYTNDDLESMSVELRKCWGLGLGPIRKLPSLIESYGITVFRLDADDIATDAFSGFLDGRPYIFSNLSKGNAARSRFDLAHELGHIAGHSHLSEDDLSERLTAVEDEANYFAGAFLLPEETFARELSDASLAGFRTMKIRWGVSIAAMIMRSWQLGLIDDHRRMELFRQRSAKGWCRKEPDDDLVERDENSVCQKAAQLLIQHDPLMYDRLLDQQQISPDILQDVFSLHRTTFAFKPTLRLLNTEPK